jgi:GNAT superfamily N-acetyltransferase
LQFEIRKVNRKTWRYFSKYHYLNENLPAGYIETFGLFHGKNQIGFQCYANYVPHRKHTKKIMHMNRLVIHPDYAGLGLGIKFVNLCSKYMVKKGFKVFSKFSSTPVFKAMTKDKNWKLENISRQLKKQKGQKMIRDNGFRLKIKTYSFKYIGE